MTGGTGSSDGKGNAAGKTAARPRSWLRPVLLLAFVAAMAIAAPAFGLGQRLIDLRSWIQSLGPLGPVVFALFYAVATVAAVPASLLTVAAGAMFGSAIGIVTVIAGATLGAAAAFSIARWVARDAVAQWLGRNPRFAKLDALTERHGAIVVAITRLVPIFPFILLNYGFGLTRVPFGTYVLWSFVCMLPGTALYVVGSDAVTRGFAEGRVPWPLVGVLAAVLAALFFFVRRARRVLAEREAAAPIPEAADGAARKGRP